MAIVKDWKQSFFWLLLSAVALCQARCAAGVSNRPHLTPQMLASMSCPDRCAVILDDCRQNVIDRCTQAAQDNSNAFQNATPFGSSFAPGVGGFGTGLGSGIGVTPMAPRVDPAVCQQSTQSCDWNYSYCHESCGGSPQYASPPPAESHTGDVPLSL